MAGLISVCLFFSLSINLFAQTNCVHDIALSKSSSNVVSAIPFAGVQVCQSGGGGINCISPDLVTLFADPAATTPISNPFFADVTGNYSFCAPAGQYKTIISGAGLAPTAFDNITIPTDLVNPIFNTILLNTGTNVPSLTVRDLTGTSTMIITTCATTSGCLAIAGASLAEVRSQRFAAVYTANGAQKFTSHIVFDTCTLGTNCAVTFIPNAGFTNSTSYRCTATDVTAANVVRVNQTSGTAVTFTGTGTDVLNYICVGN
jgi:hypothetical protein